jgi:hypothetical protein
MGDRGKFDANYGELAPYISSVPITVPLLESRRFSLCGTGYEGRSPQGGPAWARIFFYFREYFLKSGFVEVAQYVFDP